MIPLIRLFFFYWLAAFINRNIKCKEINETRSKHVYLNTN